MHELNNHKKLDENRIQQGIKTLETLIVNKERQIGEHRERLETLKSNLVEVRELSSARLEMGKRICEALERGEKYHTLCKELKMSPAMFSKLYRDYLKTRNK